MTVYLTEHLHCNHNSSLSSCDFYFANRYHIAFYWKTEIFCLHSILLENRHMLKKVAQVHESMHVVPVKMQDVIWLNVFVFISSLFCILRNLFLHQYLLSTHLIKFYPPPNGLETTLLSNLTRTRSWRCCFVLQHLLDLDFYLDLVY